MPPQGDAIMDEIERVLRSMRWPKERFLLGKVWQREIQTHLVQGQYNKAYRELHKLLKKLIRRHNRYFEYTTIQLNKNVTTNPHNHRDNIGYSNAIALGDFEGGGLRVYDADPDNNPNVASKIYRNHREFVQFDGRKFHSTIPVERGCRYAIVYFTQGVHGKPVPSWAPSCAECIDLTST
jgi:hypothetical protein